MTFYFDLDLHRLVEGLAVRRSIRGISVRRGDTYTFDVKFCQNGVVVDPGAISLYFTVKELGLYDQNPPLVLVGPFAKSGTGATAVWSAVAVFGTTPIDTLLGVDANSANDIASYSAMGEFSFQNGSAAISTDAFSVVIQNDLYRSGDTPPPPALATGSSVYLSGITALLGGGAFALDGVPTVSTSIPALVLVIINEELQTWRLQARAGQVEDGLGYVLPDDYNSVTNAKIWVRVLTGSPRVVTIASAAEPAVNVDVTEVAWFNGLSTDITNMSTNLTGTPFSEQKIIFRFLGGVAPHSLNWGPKFTSRGGILPLTVPANKYLRVGAIYNEAELTWDCVATAQE